MKKFFLNLVAISMLVLVANHIAGYFLQSRYRDWQKTGLYFEPLRWRDFYAQPENSLDIAILGSSHAYRSINPFVVDSTLGVKSFNFGSSAQSIRTSYYILNCVLPTQKNIRKVVFEIYFKVFYQDEELQNAMFNFPYMKWNREKLDFWWNGFRLKDKMTMAFFPAYQYRDQWKYVAAKILGRADPGNRGEYVGNGYVQSKRVIDYDRLIKRNQFRNFVFDESGFSGEHVYFLKKIAELCKEKNIELILVTSPIPNASYQNIKNPEAIESFTRSYADELGISYYDCLNPTKLNLSDSVDFYDDNHLNYSGAEKFTRDFIIPILKK